MVRMSKCLGADVIHLMYKILNGNYLNAEDERDGMRRREERCNMDTWRHSNMDSQHQEHV
jgi:hypothetical protein